jgi:ribosomal protein S18 acetylase RimI-like enzyme
VPAIASLTAQVQELHARTYPALFKTDVSTSDLEDVARQHLREDSQRVLVALRDDVVAGYARLEVQHRPATVIKFARAQLYIHEFGVDRHARGSGVGTALLAHIEAIAREEGIHRIGVDVFVGNEDARHFYESRGFATEREVRWLVAPEQAESDTR